MPNAEKLNLQHDDVMAFWANQDIRLVETLQSMEKLEHWTLDQDQAVEQALQVLVDRLNRLSQEANGFNMIDRSKQLLTILAYIHSGRALKLVNWLENRFSGMGVRLLQDAQDLRELQGEGAIEANLMVDRLNVVRASQHLNRIFSPERMRQVIRALES